MAHSDELRARIDSEIDTIVGEAKLMAQEILLEHQHVLNRLTDVLVERETLERDQFELLMRGGELPALEEADSGELVAVAETYPVRAARNAGEQRRELSGDGSSSTEDARWAVGEVERRNPESPGAAFRLGSRPSAAPEQDDDASDQEVA